MAIRSKVPTKEFNENYERIFGKDKFKHKPWTDRSTFEYPLIDNVHIGIDWASKDDPDFPFNNDTGN
jgi:hypothetical protein